MNYVNSYLPEDIAVISVKEASERFHSRLNATGKIYVYRIATGEVKKVFERRYIYDFGEKPDMELMCRAAEILTGTHDFKSFCSAGAQVQTTVRTIYAVNVTKEDDMVHIRITGNGFLYNMVRIIAGTLMQVGTGLMEPEQVKEILEARDRSKAGPTAVAKGLTLVEIRYE